MRHMAGFSPQTDEQQCCVIMTATDPKETSDLRLTLAIVVALFLSGCASPAERAACASMVGAVIISECHYFMSRQGMNDALSYRSFQKGMRWLADT